MDKLECFFRRFIGLMFLLLSVFAAGCARHEVMMDTSRYAPMVTSADPIAATPIPSNVATNSRIAATFNKDLDPATVNTSTFKVACGDGRDIQGVVSYLSSSRMASFMPVGSLPSNTICTAAIMKGVQDTTGITLEKAFIWTFMTGQI